MGGRGSGRSTLRPYLNNDVFGKSAGDGLGELFEIGDVAFTIFWIATEAYFEYDVLAVEVKHSQAAMRCFGFGLYATNVGLQGMSCGVEEAHCDSDFVVGSIIGEDYFCTVGSVV